MVSCMLGQPPSPVSRVSATHVTCPFCVACLLSKSACVAGDGGGLCDQTEHHKMRENAMEKEQTVCPFVLLCDHARAVHQSKVVKHGTCVHVCSSLHLRSSVSSCAASWCRSQCNALVTLGRGEGGSGIPPVPVQATEKAQINTVPTCTVAQTRPYMERVRIMPRAPSSKHLRAPLGKRQQPKCPPSPQT